MKNSEQLCKLFHGKPFLPGNFPVCSGSTSSVFKLVYSSYTCIVLASVLRWVAFLPDSPSKDKPQPSQQVAPSESTTFLRSVRKQGTVCGTCSEQCCRQCCDIRGGKGRGWNTESYRFWILRKILRPVFNAAAFSVLCKRIRRVSWQQLTLWLLQMLLKVQDQPRTFYYVYKELFKKAIRVQMNLKPQEHFHDTLITSGQAQRYILC